MSQTTDRSADALPNFIRSHLDALLAEWDHFAGSLAPGRDLSATELRDHAREILLATADDMASEQSDQQQVDKSQGLRPDSAPNLNSAAKLHGLGRLAVRFTLDDLAVEFRALRASVLRSLALSDTRVSIAQITRFNEAIDQVLAGSLAAYAAQVARTQALELEGQFRRELLLRMDAEQEADRKRIARELHDSLGQKLTAMSLCTKALEQRVADESSRQELQRMRLLLESADRELEQLVFELRPLALEARALGDAVASHVNAWSELSGVPVDLLIDGLEDGAIPEQAEVGVFRVIQEALNNVLKHAQASRVSVTLHRTRKMLLVSVEDDGVGFEPPDGSPPGRTAQSGWGLAGMRERVEALGGAFSIETKRGGGCTVLARVPIA